MKIVGFSYESRDVRSLSVCCVAGHSLLEVGAFGQRDVTSSCNRHLHDSSQDVALNHTQQHRVDRLAA